MDTLYTQNIRGKRLLSTPYVVKLLSCNEAEGVHKV